MSWKSYFSPIMPFSQTYCTPRATGTNCHEPGSLKHRNVFSHSLRVRVLKSQCWRRCPPGGACQECLLSPQPLAVPSYPWCLLAAPSSVRSASAVTRPWCKDTRHWVWTHGNPLGPHFNESHLQRPCYQHYEVPGGRGCWAVRSSTDTLPSWGHSTSISLYWYLV